MALFTFRTLAILFPSIVFVSPTSWYVAQNGSDHRYCGNSSFPCRTIRYSVAKSFFGDTIYVEHAKGVPYQECDNATRRSPIYLNKSLSFISKEGVAEIQCRNSPVNQVFVIPENSPRKQIISFRSIKITFSMMALANRHHDSRIEISNCFFERNQFAIYIKKSERCDLQIQDSTFTNNYVFGIHASQCDNVTVRLAKVTFHNSPIKLLDRQGKSRMGKHFQVFVTASYFNMSGGAVSRGNVFFQAECSDALVLNITIVTSVFEDINDAHFSKNSEKKQAPILVYDKRSKHNVTTRICFDQVEVKNVFTKHPSVVFLKLSRRFWSKTNVDILNSRFINNTRALGIRIDQSEVNDTQTSSIRVENTTFVRNYNPGTAYNRGAAATFFNGNFSIVSCKFVNNHYDSMFLTAVVVMEHSYVTIRQCYFENNESIKRSVQVFSPGNANVWLKGENVFNMERQGSSQPVILQYFSQDGAQIHLRGQLNLTCPQGHNLSSFAAPPLETRTSFDYLEISCFQCRYKTYSVERGAIHNTRARYIRCRDCPRGGVCKRGRLTSKPNFWGIRNARDNQVHFLSCPSGYCCEDEDCDTYNGCYGSRTGTLCGKCAPGTSELLVGTECQRNEECRSAPFWIGISFMVPLFSCFFLYHHDIMKYLMIAVFSSAKSFPQRPHYRCRNFQSTKPIVHETHGGFVKIIFYYYQIVHIFNFSASGPGKIVKEITLVLASVFNFLATNLYIKTCPFQNIQPIQKAIILHSLGFLLLLFIGVLFIMWKIYASFKKPQSNSSSTLYIDAAVYVDNDRAIENMEAGQTSKQSFKCRLVGAFTYVYLLMYSSSAQLCLSLLHCVPVGSDEVLFIDGTVICYQIFQYFVLAYVVVNVIPFCLVPVLGSYLLAFGSIPVTDFCLACLFPLPVCCKWVLVLYRRWRERTSQGYVAVSPQFSALLGEDCSDDIPAVPTPRLAILRVLLGPFRSHSSFLCFPQFVIPWEGFLIFRRLVIILLFTFIYDVNLRMCLVLLTCVLILVCHLVVKPFQRTSDNVLEAISLTTLIVLCGFTHVKAIYSGSDKTAINIHPGFFNALETIESVIIVAPISLFLLMIVGAVIYKFLAWLLQLMSKIFK